MPTYKNQKIVAGYILITVPIWIHVSSMFIQLGSSLSAAVEAVSLTLALSYMLIAGIFLIFSEGGNSVRRILVVVFTVVLIITMFLFLMVAIAGPSESAKYLDDQHNPVRSGVFEERACGPVLVYYYNNEVRIIE